MADQSSEGRIGVGRRLKVGRGLLRLWLVFSVLWLTGVGFAYRPQACRYNPLGSAIQAPHDLFHCLSFLYDGAVLDRIAVLMPTAQGGMRWDGLTRGQQKFVVYRLWDIATINKAAQTGSEDDDWAELTAERETKERIAQAKAHPEQFRYYLVPIEDIRSSIAEWSHPLGYDYPQELIEFLAIAFGIPLAVGCGGILILRVGRWVWSGFAAAV